MKGIEYILSDLDKTNDYMEKKWVNRFIIAALQETLNEYL